MEPDRTDTDPAGENTDRIQHVGMAGGIMRPNTGQVYGKLPAGVKDSDYDTDD